MAERFTYYYPSQIIKDNKTGQRYYGNKSLADLLNELHEENQRLQEENKELEKFKHFIFKSLNHIYEDKE